MKNKLFALTFPVILASCTLFVAAVHADDDGSRQQDEPITLLVNFQIKGVLNGMSPTGPVYTVGGPGYVPDEIYSNGVVSNKIDPEKQIVQLDGALITFSGDPNTDPIINFTCLAGSCTMKFKDGSVLQSNAGVPLEGRAIMSWGPVVRSSSFDPVNQIYPFRILGCGGLKETAGKGRLAGMVGSVCFNGIMNFNQVDPSTLTGASKCTITMHTPIYPIP